MFYSISSGSTLFAQACLTKYMYIVKYNIYGESHAQTGKIYDHFFTDY